SIAIPPPRASAHGRRCAESSTASVRTTQAEADKSPSASLRDDTILVIGAVRIPKCVSSRGEAEGSFLRTHDLKAWRASSRQPELCFCQTCRMPILDTVQVPSPGPLSPIQEWRTMASLPAMTMVCLESSIDL